MGVLRGTWACAGQLPEVVEVKRRPRGGCAQFACRLLERWPAGVALFYVVGEARSVADVHLEPGVATFAYYWRARWYNVYHWVTPEGRTLAYYVNVATPARLRQGTVEWTDLGADVLVRPEAGPEILDARELQALPTPLQAPARRSLEHVLRAWRRIVQEAEARTRRLYRQVTGGGHPGPQG
ncbi:hypothetical protein HRbin32_00834 [bacterium HR32]|nr:hypothetical protein HRbin32_00834 [bacterium HR32]